MRIMIAERLDKMNTEDSVDYFAMLTINKQGQLCYCNLKNGGGCRTGEEPQDWYEFVPNEDRYGYNIDPRTGEMKGGDTK